MDKFTEAIKKLERLRPYVQSVTTARLDPNRLFSLCLRASFSKSFNFVDYAINSPDMNQAFYQVSALRSICEDIIYLSYIARLKPIDRETIIKCKMFIEIEQGISAQTEFFRAFSIVQPVLNASASSVKLKKVKDEFSDVWKANGFPNTRKGQSPPTREIAEAVDPGMLDIVYEYIFRLTSRMVHFSPQHLLRTGWGDLRATTFSTTNMGPYFVAIAQIYGIFLFCLYFTLHSASVNQHVIVFSPYRRNKTIPILSFFYTQQC